LVAVVAVTRVGVTTMLVMRVGMTEVAVARGGKMLVALTFVMKLAGIAGRRASTGRERQVEIGC
jgi:hypothetical protein